MKLLLSLCTFFQLLLSSFSSFCRVPLLSSKWKEDHIRAPEQNENLTAPWLAKVFGHGKICQGVILSKWWVLTAASCFLLMKPSRVELIGIHGHFSTIAVSHFVSHWSISSWDAVPNSDLGLIRLAQPIDLERKDMWPLCVPHSKESPDVLVQCNIFEQHQTQQKGHKKWLIKRIMVHTTELSACATQWPDATVQWNLCVEREVSKHRDCMVPVGSPVICREPARKQWELVAIVSQILHDCTAPVLTTLIIPHHQWLQKELAKMNHFQPHHIKAGSGKSSSPRTKQDKKEVPSTTRQPAAFSKGESFQKWKKKPLRKHTATIKSHPKSIKEPEIPRDEKEPLTVSVKTELPPLKITKSLQVPVILPEEKQPLTVSVKTELPPLKITKSLQVPVILQEEKQPLTVSVKTELPPLKITKSLQVPVILPEEKQPLTVSVKTELPPLIITKSLQVPVILPEEEQPVTVSVETELPPLIITKSLQVPVILPEEKNPLTVPVKTELLPLMISKTTKYTSTVATKQPTPEEHSILVTPSISQHSTIEEHIILVAFPTTQIPVTSTTTQSLPHIPETEHVVIIPSIVSKAPSIVSSTQKLQSSATAPTSRQKHVVIMPSTTSKSKLPQLRKSKRDIAQFPDLSVMLRAPLATAIRRTSGLESPVQVTMEQCKMGLVWNSNSHTFQLNKMAVLMDRRVGCGLRPRFVPKCPTCSEPEVGEFPWIVSLKLSIRHICTGSILNPKWILTTASCANLIKNSEELALAQPGLTDVTEKTHSVPIRQALTHPHWLASNDLHNVGLLQLEKSLDMEPLTAPTCLLDKANMMHDFKDCWLPGWTVLEGGLAILLRHPLHILNTSNCSLFGEEHSGAIFCMKALRGRERACQGDVGSPLICHDPQSGAWVQLGVLSSFDEACSHPYVFSSLPYYLPWLESTTRTEGHNDNLTLPWEWQDPTKHLRVLQESETLIKQISAYFSMPWQVLIATCGNRSCVGSILDHYWVLTTAHCVQEVDPANTAVFVGLKHPSGQVQGIRVTGIYPHEEILQYSLIGDNTVALLLLQRPIIFDQHVTSMSFSQVESWDNCKVMGLQLLQFGEVETDPSVYQVKVLSPSECAKELRGVSPNMYCIVRHKNSHRPAAAAAVGEGAALLCRLEAKSTSWSQVGLMNKPFPGSQPVVLSSSITSYVDWMEETSKQAKHILSLTSGRAAFRPSSWLLLLLLSLFGATELG